MKLRARRLWVLVVAAAIPFVAPGSVGVATAAPCAAGDVHVAVVVDFGDGGSLSSVCVGAGARDNGATLLAARAEQLGTPAPRFDASGLVCAIDGYPTDGCGEQTGSRYAYWSYWHGGAGGWDYSSVGPAGSRVNAGVTEGWRFQPDGAGNPTDPPPRGAPDPEATCAPPATTPPATQPPETRAPEVQPPVSEPSGPSPSGATPTTTAPGSADTSVGTASDAATTTSSTGTTSTTIATSTGPSGNAAPGPIGVRDNGSGGPPWGLLGGAGLVGGVGAAGAVVARRRGRLPT